MARVSLQAETSDTEGPGDVFSVFIWKLRDNSSSSVNSQGVYSSCGEQGPHRPTFYQMPMKI